MLEDCENDPSIESDKVIIYLEGLLEPFNAEEQQLVEGGFVDAYNKASGGCDDIFIRFMESADLINQTIIPLDAEMTYLDTLWTADVRCEGCDPDDPLFGGGEFAIRHLQSEVSLFESFIFFFDDFMRIFPDYKSILFASTDGMEHVIRNTPDPIDDCGVNPDTESGRVVLYLEGLKR